MYELIPVYGRTKLSLTEPGLAELKPDIYLFC